MGKYVAILFGLIAMAGGVVVCILWPGIFWRDLKIVVGGMIPPLLFFGGLIALIAGISSIKDAARTKKLEEETKQEKA
jgi:uncharacterized membrane protein